MPSQPQHRPRAEVLFSRQVSVPYRSRSASPAVYKFGALLLFPHASRPSPSSRARGFAWLSLLAAVPMACLLLVLVVAAAVLTAPPGKLTHAARTPTSPEAFWRAALPGEPMPESIRELLRPSAEVVKAPSADADVRDDDPPPPMNFNYDDYRASPSPRNQLVVATFAKAPEHVGARNAATGDDDRARASPPAVFFLEDAVRVGGSLPFPRGLLPRAASGDDEEAPAARQPPLELYTVRAVRAVEGSSFVVCRGEARPDGGGAVYGCRGVGPARAYAVDVAGERGDAVTATVVCHGDDGASNGNLEHAASRLLGVGGGVGAAVCYAVPDAQILLVKSEKVPSSA
ncbi:hypothetical protein SEVIR_2G258700v4 [Setaria viridis]|uniref:BURP domain-containing protein n=1 Tax=Setaria viridis TaxID=4556 RepID=A0A4U6VXW1_SETVI|nr:hypothetical protein SEVIR_2G258700v2 [Setaria viridis]